MKKLLYLVTIMPFVVFGMFGSDTRPHVPEGSDFMAREFTDPASTPLGCYWYWMCGNVSREGVVKDLHAMKEIGITRAYIGNIGMGGIPFTDLWVLSDEWWDVMHTAIKTAGELGITIGVFNCPGWSQSGGPWVTDRESMRYLTSAEQRISGPESFCDTLSKPDEKFQDVKVLAYPAPENDKLKIDLSNSRITSTPRLEAVGTLVDGDIHTGLCFDPKTPQVIDFVSDRLFPARAVTITPMAHEQCLDVELQAKDNGVFRTIKSFIVDRSWEILQVGFKPYGPVVESFPPTSSKEFRIIIKDGNPSKGVEKLGVAEIEISAAPRMERYIEKTLAKTVQTENPTWSTYLWDSQPRTDLPSLVVQPSQVLDISDKMSADGVLRWDVPPGEWIVARMGMMPTGTINVPAWPADGPETDKMNKKHIRKHFDAHIGELLRRIPEEDRKSFRVVVMDSWETGAQNFTDDFIAHFEKAYGYDPVPYLPVYEGRIIGSADISDRFLWDVRRLVADMAATEYMGGMAEESHKHGLTTWLEPYGHYGFPTEGLLYGKYSDEVAGEFWMRDYLGDVECKIAVSSVHIYGKPRIWAESFTSLTSTFEDMPADMKRVGDKFFAMGINSTILHVIIAQWMEDSAPGINAWFGSEFNRKNTWFGHADLFVQYLKRVGFMLQQGRDVADIAYFLGEDTPRMVGVTVPEVPRGYRYDYINADVIMNDMRVEDGLITLGHGTQYRVMVLPPLTTMRPELLAKIEQLVHDGAVVYGAPPKRSPSLQGYPDADKTVARMAKKLWGKVDGDKVRMRRYGKGTVINGMGMQQVMDFLGCVPAFRTNKGDELLFGHRGSASDDIYFISNQTEKEQIFDADFRVVGKQPELWNAVDGSIRELASFVLHEKTTTVPLKLAPYESCFVVFRNAAHEPREEKDYRINYPRAVDLTSITSPWSVEFRDKSRGPGDPVVFDRLADWTENENELIKYYSGVATYRNSFDLNELPSQGGIILDLKDVAGMAKVKINGRYAGGVWTSPYRLDITDFVKKGQNSVEIDVVNVWANRLIGDLGQESGNRTTHALDFKRTPESPLTRSGLIGPVSIEHIVYSN